MSTDRLVKLDLAVVQFAGEGTAVSRYATAKDRTADAAWMHEVGFIERHHNGRLLLRGMFAGHYLDVDESDHISQRGAEEGAVAGGLIGVLAGPPGIAVGLPSAGCSAHKPASRTRSRTSRGRSRTSYAPRYPTPHPRWCSSRPHPRSTRCSTP